MVANKTPTSYNKDKKTPTSLSRNIDAAEAKIQYDEYAKKILGDKQILSRIFQKVVKEAKDLSLSEIEDCIEKAEINCVSIYPGLSNKDQVQGISTESAIGKEGKINFDVRTFITVPIKGKLVKIIINLEGQKKFHPGYRIETRAIFYNARQLSMQLDTEFFIPDYDSICKVYTIWICFDSTKKEANAIAEYNLHKTDIIPGIKDNPAAYDKMSVVIITLNEKVPSDDILVSMLNVLFSQTKMTSKEKKENLSENYGLDMDRDLGKEIEDMCNFSDLIEERAIEQGIEQGNEQGRRLELDYGIRTAIKAYSMLGSSYEKARAFIIKEYNLSPSDAESKMQEYWEN